MRSCFQRNSIAVLVSKLVSKILCAPPSDYIGSSRVTERTFLDTRNPLKQYSKA